MSGIDTNRAFRQSRENLIEATSRLADSISADGGRGRVVRGSLGGMRLAVHGPTGSPADQLPPACLPTPLTSRLTAAIARGGPGPGDAVAFEEACLAAEESAAAGRWPDVLVAYRFIEKAAPVVMPGDAVALHAALCGIGVASLQLGDHVAAGDALERALKCAGSAQHGKANVLRIEALITLGALAVQVGGS